jgi:hypothetical protein
MSNFPSIHTAIPKQRYQYGEYSISVLGEIESPDPQNYQYIMAFVPEGKSQPVLFVCSQKSFPKDRHLGSHQLRIVNQAMSEIMSTDDRWRDMDSFVAEALKLGEQILGLAGERLTQLM